MELLKPTKEEIQELADFIADEADRIQPKFELLAEQILKAGWVSRSALSSHLSRRVMSLEASLNASRATMNLRESHNILDKAVTDFIAAALNKGEFDK